jgi:hypothetical protein
MMEIGWRSETIVDAASTNTGAQRRALNDLRKTAKGCTDLRNPPPPE